MRRGHGEGSIYQRASDGRWLAVVQLGYVGGKKRTKTVSAKTRKECLARLKALQASMDMGVVPGNATVEQWLRYWLDHILPETARASTIASHRWYVEAWLIPQLGKVPLSSLSPDHVRTMYAAMRRHRGDRTPDGLSPSTIRRARAVLQSALTVAVDEGKTLRNAAELAKLPVAEKNPHPHLTEDHARAVIDAATDARERARLAVALMLGLRQSEALGLTWADVHLEEGWADVRQSVQRIKGQGLVVGALKTRKSRRQVELNPAVLHLMGVWKAVGPGEGFVFHGIGGPATPGDPRRDYQLWRDALVRAGVPHVPLHGARGTGASIMSEDAQDWVISEVLGHAAVEVTQNHYLHSTREQRRSALAVLDRLVTPNDQ